MKESKKRPMIKTLHCVITDELDAALEAAFIKTTEGDFRPSRAEFTRFVVRKGLEALGQGQASA